MEEIIKYKSQDGKDFTDPLECALYEIESFPEILQKIDSVLDKSNVATSQQQWCRYNGESGGCACSGCVNSEFREAGLTKYHWKIWYDYYRPEFNFDTARDEFGIVITSLGDNKMEGLKFIRENFQLPIQEITKLTKKQPVAVMCRYPIFYLKKYKRKLDELGVQSSYFHNDIDNTIEDPKYVIFPINKVQSPKIK